jgi:hypothetical protein
MIAEAHAANQDAFVGLLGRLSRQSVAKHFDAYADINWDDPMNRIDPTDSRWELPATHPLGATAWYRALPADIRARLGLHLWATLCKVGAQFENWLQRGLLEFVLTLPDDAPEIRYAYHEVIEEGHHSQMFLEFVRRAALATPGIPLVRLRGRILARFGGTFPQLFFLGVMLVEHVLDRLQRQALRSRPLHPLSERIMRIHTTEEARHLSFARHYLDRTLPRLGRVRRWLIRWYIPLVTPLMLRTILRAPTALVAEYGIPTDVMQEAYATGETYRAFVFDAIRSIHDVCAAHGLITSRSIRLWRRLDLITA